MAYKQVKKYGYRDELDKGDPEKVIMGVDFDAEFEAIEQAFDDVPGMGGDPIAPEAPGLEDVVFQNRLEAQKVISEFTFEKSGDSPLTMKSTGMYAGTAYIRYTGVTWEVDPSLNVTGDITAGGNLTVDGTTQLNGDLSVDGNIGATGNISLDGDLAVGGVIDGDLTVNGNLIIEGGSVIDPDGNPTAGFWEETSPGSGDIFHYGGFVQVRELADGSGAEMALTHSTVGGNGSALYFADNSIIPTSGGLGFQDNEVVFASDTYRLKNLYSYKVSTNFIEDFVLASNRDNNLGIAVTNVSSDRALEPTDGMGRTMIDGQIDLGRPGNRWRDAYLQNAVTAGSFVRAGGKSDEYLMADGSVSSGSGGGGSSSLWEQNGSNIYYNDGSVGIGTDAPAHPLEVISNGTALNDRSVRINSDRAKNVIGFGSSSGAGVNLPNVGVDGTNFVVDNGGITRLTIDTSGDATFSGKVLASNVGSETNACGLRFSAASDGGASTRVVPTDTSSVADGVVDIGSASGRFKDAHFSGTVNAGSAVITTRNVTGAYGAGFLNSATDTGVILTDNGSAFCPTEDDTRSLGSTDLRFRNATFSGTVSVGEVNVATNKIWRAGFSGFQFTDSIRPLRGDGTQSDGELSLGTSDQKFKDGWFSGTVNAGNLVIDGGNSFYRASAGAGGIKFTTLNSIIPTDNTGTNTDGELSLGSNASQRFKDAYFSGTVDAAGFTVNGVPIGGGAGGLPAGDWHCTGSITATGNITAYSSSDERLKDDITPMPVGLIDGIKPVQFKWKDGGKSSGGVIAQQLQEIGLDDFVHEAPNGDLGVDYNALVGVLLAEVIELKKRLADDS